MRLEFGLGNQHQVKWEIKMGCFKVPMEFTVASVTMFKSPNGSGEGVKGRGMECFVDRMQDRGHWLC